MLCIASVSMLVKKYVVQFVSDLQSSMFILCITVSSTNATDRQNINKILLQSNRSTKKVKKI